jgi:hypothetical protein
VTLVSRSTHGSWKKTWTVYLMREVLQQAEVEVEATSKREARAMALGMDVPGAQWGEIDSADPKVTAVEKDRAVYPRHDQERNRPDGGSTMNTPIEKLEAQRVVRLARGSWRWQEAYAVVRYRTRRARDGRWLWVSDGKITNKCSMPQLRARGYAKTPHGSLHNRLVDHANATAWQREGF